MGTDHTLFAVEPGYVRFYQPHPDPSIIIQSNEASGSTRESILGQAMKGLAISPLRQETALPIYEPARGHPSSSKRRTGRRYVGVVLEEGDVLPAPVGEPIPRRLGLVNVRRETKAKVTLVEGASAVSQSNSIDEQAVA
jgi:hypothetical protein